MSHVGSPWFDSRRKLNIVFTVEPVDFNIPIFFIVLVVLPYLLRSGMCTLGLKLSLIFCLQLRTKIKEMEQASLAAKPWQLMGEAAGGTRPQNSLLQEDLQFEHTGRTGNYFVILPENVQYREIKFTGMQVK
jgi:hypothetical protein